MADENLEYDRIGLEDQMIGLYRNIFTMLATTEGVSIQFISSRPDEGSSTLIRAFANVAAMKLDKTVLLIDADPKGSQCEYFDIEPHYSWKEVILGGKPMGEALYQVGRSSLYVSQMARSADDLTQIVHVQRTKALLQALKQDFDLVLLDPPPGTVSADGLTLSHKVDGVIIVVEAEKTRWQIAHSTKEKIEMRGGEILGVILNNRRYYIPKFIYDRM